MTAAMTQVPTTSDPLWQNLILVVKALAKGFIIMGSPEDILPSGMVSEKFLQHFGHLKPYIILLYVETAMGTGTWGMRDKFKFYQKNLEV